MEYVLKKLNGYSFEQILHLPILTLFQKDIQVIRYFQKNEMKIILRKRRLTYTDRFSKII